jgi:hypothetical protein
MIERLYKGDGGVAIEDLKFDQLNCRPSAAMGIRAS